MGRRPAGHGPHRRRRSRPTSRRSTSGTATTTTHDGNFNEPDGYIDHFQIVHAGGDQADGDPHQGEDAIWSHRWKAFQDTSHGPAFNKDGGTQIGTHRPVGRGLHDPARERRPVRVRARVRPRPRPAGPLRHRGGRQRRQLVDADGPEPRLRRRATRASAPSPPTSARGTSSSSAGSTTRSCPPAQTARSTSARTSTTAPRRRASSCRSARRQVPTTYGAPAAGTKQWWSGTGDDLDDSMTRLGHAARRAPATLTFQAALEHRGLRHRRRATTRTSRSTTGRASRRSRADRQGGRGQRHRRRPGDLDARDVRPVLATPARRSSCACATAPTARRRATRTPSFEPGLYADQITIKSGSTTVFSDGAETGANGWTPGRVHRRRRVRRRASTTTTTWPPTARTRLVGQVPEDGPVQLRVPADRPDWVEHFPYQNGLLVNYWDTSYSDNNESRAPR